MGMGMGMALLLDSSIDDKLIRVLLVFPRVAGTFSWWLGKHKSPSSQTLLLSQLQSQRKRREVLLSVSRSGCPPQHIHTQQGMLKLSPPPTPTPTPPGGGGGWHGSGGRPRLALSGIMIRNVHNKRREDVLKEVILFKSMAGTITRCTLYLSM